MRINVNWILALLQLTAVIAFYYNNQWLLELCLLGMSGTIAWIIIPGFKPKQHTLSEFELLIYKLMAPESKNPFFKMLGTARINAWFEEHDIPEEHRLEIFKRTIYEVTDHINSGRLDNVPNAWHKGMSHVKVDIVKEE